ncbi:MAG: hypothetical protein M9962_04515 [Oligoflexia bacterium]|nr:hypothetical protein [Oligoflexia bacterium]
MQKKYKFLVVVIGSIIPCILFLITIEVYFGYRLKREDKVSVWKKWYEWQNRKSNSKTLIDRKFALSVSLPEPIEKSGNYPKLESLSSTYKPAYKDIFNSDYFPKPNVMYEETFSGLDEKKLFSINYFIDEYQRRFNPVRKKSKRDFFISLFGCSYVYGVGVNIDNTLGEYMQASLNSTTVYNYGIGGTGPASSLLRLEKWSPKNEIYENKGIGLYFFMDDHIARSIGSMRVSGVWGKNLPVYKENSHQKMTYLGTFEEVYPIRTFIFSLLSKSNFLKFHGIDFPIRFNEEEFRYTAELIKAQKERFLASFPSQNFYVVLYPGSSAVFSEEIIEELEKLEIQYLDYSNIDLRKYVSGEIWLPDFHPSAATNQFLAHQIIQDLHLK